MNEVNLNEYQNEINKFVYRRPNSLAIIYPALGLAGETGEVLEKVKKMIRDDSGNLTEERRQALTKELGDVLAYLAELTTDLDITLEEVAQSTFEKMRSRKERGTTSGDGDDR